MGYYLNNPSERTRAVAARLEDWDSAASTTWTRPASTMQILSLTSPGVQIFDADTAVGLARSANDELAAAIAAASDALRGSGRDRSAESGSRRQGARARRPHAQAQRRDRQFATHGEYLDDEKFWDIFAAAEALDVPIYIHPNTPPNAMIKPFMERGLDGAVFGFAVETGLHALRIVVSGAFDRFPNLRIVLGHLGEGLPYWLPRIDFMHGASVARTATRASRNSSARRATI